MELISLRKSSIGKGAWATYKFVGGRIEVYLRNNKACKNEWGDLIVSCYVKPTGSNEDITSEIHRFTDYNAFRQFRNNYLNNNQPIKS